MAGPATVVERNAMNFITVLQSKGWIATIRYMYTLYNTIQCDKNAT